MIQDHFNECYRTSVSHITHRSHGKKTPFVRQPISEHHQRKRRRQSFPSWYEINTKHKLKTTKELKDKLTNEPTPSGPTPTKQTGRTRAVCSHGTAPRQECQESALRRRGGGPLCGAKRVLMVLCDGDQSLTISTKQEEASFAPVTVSR